MVITQEEKLCFSKALDILESTAWFIAGASSSSSSTSSSPTASSLSSVSIATSCQQLEDLLLLCIDLLLVDGDPKRAGVLLDDSRLLDIIRRFLTTNPMSLTPIPTSTSNNNSNGMRPVVDDDGEHVTAHQWFTPIAFSLFQMKALAVVRDIFVSIVAIPSLSVTLAQKLLHDQWLEVLLRYMSLNENKFDVEALVLEAIYVLSTIFSSHAKRQLTTSGRGHSGGTPPSSSSLVKLSLSEVALVANRVRCAFTDVAVRNFAIGTLRVWLCSSDDNNSSGGGGDSAAAVEYGRRSSHSVKAFALHGSPSGAFRELIAGTLTWLFVEGMKPIAPDTLKKYLLQQQAYQQQQQQQSLVPSHLQFTLCAAVELWFHYILRSGDDYDEDDDDVVSRQDRNSSAALPNVVVHDGGENLLTQLLVFRMSIVYSCRGAQQHSAPVANSSAPIRSSKQQQQQQIASPTSASSSSRIPQSGTLFMLDAILESLVISPNMFSHLLHVREWLLTMWMLNIDISAPVARCNIPPPSEVGAHWLRLSFQSLLGAGRFDDVCNALHEPLVDCLVSASETMTLWSVMVSLLRETTDSRDAAGGAGEPLQVKLEVALCIGLLAVAGCRQSTRKMLLRDMMKPIGVDLLRFVHRLFLGEGHKGSIIVLCYSADGELLNSIDFVDVVERESQGGGCWHEAEELYDAVAFILDVHREERLSELVDLDRATTTTGSSFIGKSVPLIVGGISSHRPAAAHQPASRSSWVEKHHKLVTALISFSVLKWLSS